jgi:hypothetical protein
MAAQQFRQVTFEDGHSPFAQQFYLGFVVIHAGNLVAYFGETHSGYEPDVP